MCATDIEYEPFLWYKHKQDYQIVILVQFQGFGAGNFLRAVDLSPLPPKSTQENKNKQNIREASCAHRAITYEIFSYLVQSSPSSMDQTRISSLILTVMRQKYR